MGFYRFRCKFYALMNPGGDPPTPPPPMSQNFLNFIQISENLAKWYVSGPSYEELWIHPSYDWKLLTKTVSVKAICDEKVKMKDCSVKMNNFFIFRKLFRPSIPSTCFWHTQHLMVWLLRSKSQLSKTLFRIENRLNIKKVMSKVVYVSCFNMT